MVATKKTKLFVHTQLSVTFQQYTLLSFLYSFYLLLSLLSS
jgi:hypothetical protein